MSSSKHSPDDIPVALSAILPGEYTYTSALADRLHWERMRAYRTLEAAWRKRLLRSRLGTRVRYGRLCSVRWWWLPDTPEPEDRQLRSLASPARTREVRVARAVGDTRRCPQGWLRVPRPWPMPAPDWGLRVVCERCPRREECAPAINTPPP